MGLGGNRLGQRSAPGSRVEGVGEVLGLVRHETVGDLHDAERVRGHAVIGDHALAHPQVASAHDPPDGEVAFGRVPAALRLDPRPASEALAGLRIVQDRVGSVDRVLGVDVPAFGGLPVLLDPGSDVGFTISCAAQPVPVMTSGCRPPHAGCYPRAVAAGTWLVCAVVSRRWVARGVGLCGRRGAARGGVAGVPCAAPRRPWGAVAGRVCSITERILLGRSVGRI